ncbi:hypothetical protein EDD15DRAFT_2358529 [Pisolithus albus]|nr:hypothetical protein EDD15DRAFT_2358529 [Pisolithus albus]
MSQKDGGGIQAWTTSIRAAMANDPCRQLFEDQIQVHAFLFLEDYFESIISGPQQAPIIELVKTPSRKKKNIPRKARIVTADPVSTIEFQPNTSDDQGHNSPLSLHSQGRVNELSVIAEDDEPLERPHIRTTSPPTASDGYRHMETGSLLVSKATLIQPADVVQAGSGTEEQVTSGMDSTCATTLIRNPHPVPPDSSHQRYPSNTCTGENLPSSPRPSQAASLNPQDAALVPSVLNSNSSSNPTTILPNPEPANTAPKSSALHYPTLPAPSPLRKSIRVPAEMAISLPSTTPVPAPLGKRTSWLVKAREAKAMEGAVIARSDILNDIPAPVDSSASEVPVVSASMKRKSGEILGCLSQSRNTGERASKVPKMNELDTVSTRTNDDGKSGGCGSVDADGVGKQGFIGQFKRTVEGLGARSGRSMTKSLGGAAATAALAEARAAAEARVAERNKATEVSSDLVEIPDLVVPPQPLSAHQDEEPTSSRSKPDDVERPHFVFDLVSDNAKRQGTQAPIIPQIQNPDLHDGLSTTPPHSPHQKHTPVVKHTGPVFTKRTVPTTLQPTKPLTSAVQLKDFSNLPLGTFTLTTPMSLGVVPQLNSRTTTFTTSSEDEGRVLDQPVASETANRTALDHIGGHEENAIDSLDSEGSMMDICELGDASETARHTVNQGEPAGVIRSDSQLSMTSATSSSQSETGFLGQATKLVASILGGGKKDRPEIKSLQRAAATAKRQQDEADKKASRLKEMEARRQAVLSRKVEEEKARVLEDEKRAKEDSERRKRDREENTDKRPMKVPTATVKKLEDDSTKKRKFLTETQKKVETKKPLSKDKKDLVPLKLVKPSVPTPAAKSTLPSKSVRCVASALVSSAAYNASQTLPGVSSGSKSAIPEAKPFKLAPAHKDKVKAVAQNDGNDKLPSAMIQTQMAARAKAQLEASKQQPPEVPSESIELPDINSEYSDSEDEDRVRTFDPPDWAQSPELRQALQMQSTVNPDDIFGSIRPLRMEEMFRTRQSRFRARTSSANWSGADRLTIEEIRDYERRMGFRSEAQ